MTAAAALALAGCSDIAGREALVNRLSTSAVVAADDPYAATAGRDVLEAGGNAIDAAVAMTLTMAVTLPSRVGLTGGGVCITRTFGKTGHSEQVLSFPAEPVQGRTLGLPALGRGLTVLHEAGLLRWEEVVAPAERLARFGHRVSRAMAADIGAVGRPVPLPGWEAVAPRAAEGVMVQQVALAGTLGALRTRGAGLLYQGSLANALAQAANVRPDMLGGTHPKLESPVSTISTFIGGTVRSAVPATPAQASGPTAGLVALDAQGTVVACRLSMGGLFGTGQAVPVGGLLLAKPTPLASLTGVGLAFGQSVGEVIGVVSAGDMADRAALIAAVSDGAIEAGPVMAQLPQGGNLATVGFCPKGISAGCRASADPRGYGLSLDMVK